MWKARGGRGQLTHVGPARCEKTRPIDEFRIDRQNYRLLDAVENIPSRRCWIATTWLVRRESLAISYAPRRSRAIAPPNEKPIRNRTRSPTARSPSDDFAW